MKIKALLCVSIFLLALCSGGISAQQLKIGLKAGTGIPNLRNDGTNEISMGYSSIISRNFGVIADIGLSKRLSIKTGLDYAGQGGIRKGQQPIPNLPAQFAQMLPSGTYLYASFDNESNLNYLEVPLMGKLEFGKKLKYYVNAGPYLGFLLNAKQKTSGTSQLFLDKNGTIPLTIQGQPLPAQSMDATTDIENDIHSTNLGLTGGVGLAIPVWNRSALLIDARAAYGLNSIQKDIATYGSSRTGGIFLTLGYVFSLGKESKQISMQ
jgi:hypothetical protein